jgi:hypothetical protein
MTAREALTVVVEDEFLKAYMMENLDLFRSQELWLPRIDLLLKCNYDVLKKIYDLNSDKKMKSPTIATCERLVRRLNLDPAVTKRMFVTSKMTIINE